MKWSAVHSSAARSSHNHWNADPLSIPACSGVVGQNIEATRDKVDKLHLGNWSHTHHCGATGRSYDRGFGDWSIDYPFFPKTVLKSLGYFESSAVYTNVLAEQKYAIIAFHLFPEPLSDCLKQRYRGHMFFVLSIPEYRWPSPV